MQPVGLLSSNVHRSQSDRDLLTVERRVTRTRLVSSSSSSALNFLARTTRSSQSRSQSSVLLPWDRLEKWIYGIALVNFDLELGHTIEFLLPNHCKLSEDEKKNLAYLAFPDTNAKCSGDIQYHFRLQQHHTTLPSYYNLYNAVVPPALQVETNSLFAYVNFRQTREKTLKRGYLQKSLVVLSKLPFFALFTTLAKQLAIHYFEQGGREALELLCQRMDSQWPEPKAGETLRLAFSDHIYQVRIPTHGDKPFSSSDLVQFRSTLHEATAPSPTTSPINQTVNFPIDDDVEIDSGVSSFSLSDQDEAEKSGNADTPKASLIPFVHDVNTFQSLSSVLPHIQLLWELILLNEPIAILGNYPTNCSQTVQALVHIIWPLRYASDYRPYFTIHNSEFSQLMRNERPPALIIGVTNPIFSKMILRWPHVIRLNDTSQDDFSKRKQENFLLVEHDDDELAVNELEESFELSMSPPRPVITEKVSTHGKPMKVNDSTPSDIKVGLYTKYRPYLRRDKTILRKLQSTRSQQRPDVVQNALLRRFFLELTQSFIIPLERYFSSLLPFHKLYHPNRDPPTLKKFDNEEFLKTVDQHGPQLTTGLKGDWKDLYKQFLNTPNFRLWLTNRREEAKEKIFTIYIGTIANCRLEEDFRFSRLNEVEIVDLVIKFRDLIQCLESPEDRRVVTLDAATRKTFVEKLKLKMDFMIDQHLSTDMKTLFHQ